MDYRVLLIQSIGLLYWESTIPEQGMDSRLLISDIIKSLPAPESLAGTDDDRENLIALRDLTLHLVNSEISRDKEYLLSKVKMSIKRDPELREDITSILDGELNEEQVVERIQSLQRDLNTFFFQKDFKEEIRRIAAKTIYAGAPHFNVSDMARGITAAMERFVDSATNANDDPALNGAGDTSDPEELAKTFMLVQEDLSPESVIKTGWQAFNRMCGEVGGIRRGNMYVVGARPSNGKSLVTSSITLDAMCYNKPYMFDPTKKPAVLHISTENDIPLNMKIWFRRLWEIEHNAPCNIQDMDPLFMAKWFIERVQKNGHFFKFYHIDPTNTSYHDILSRFAKLEAEGYEIQLATIDYLGMINGEGLGDENRAFWIRQLFKVIRNYTNPRRIAVLVPHQVATDAANLLRAGTDDFVKQIAGKRYWADCRSIDMEVDMEVVLNIEVDSQGNAWMAFGRGKDRSSSGTPEKDKFFFIPFSQYGGLRPDIEGKDSSKKTIRETGVVMPDNEWNASELDF